jgi:hypothetical protein
MAIRLEAERFKTSELIQSNKSLRNQVTMLFAELSRQRRAIGTGYICSVCNAWTEYGNPHAH